VSQYQTLLDELDRYVAARDSRPPATFTQRAAPADATATLAKASAAVARAVAHVSRYARYVPPRRRMTPQARRQQFSEFTARVTSAYRAGTITADQLASLEAHRHRVADTLASRGAL
jgi:hypothetical protein